jgi:hypothetical protein
VAVGGGCGNLTLAVAGWQWQFDTGCGNLTLAVAGWRWVFKWGDLERY